MLGRSSATKPPTNDFRPLSSCPSRVWVLGSAPALLEGGAAGRRDLDFWQIWFSICGGGPEVEGRTFLQYLHELATSCYVALAAAGHHHWDTHTLPDKVRDRQVHRSPLVFLVLRYFYTSRNGRNGQMGCWSALPPSLQIFR